MRADDPECWREAWALSHFATAGLGPQLSMSFLIVALVVVAGVATASTL